MRVQNNKHYAGDCARTVLFYPGDKGSVPCLQVPSLVILDRAKEYLPGGSQQYSSRASPAISATKCKQNKTSYITRPGFLHNWRHGWQPCWNLAPVRAFVHQTPVPLDSCNVKRGHGAAETSAFAPF